ncbi:MAG: TadE/TadG family type IV pilus assembly protein [Actinomycetota bacterium]
MNARRESGAALVEAALILPVLLLLVFGIIDFSRAYNAKQTLTHASREAVRVYSVTEDLAKTQAAFDAAVTSIGSATLTLDPEDGCLPGDPVTAAVSYEFDFVTLPFASLTLGSEAVMRCGG